MKMQSEYWTLNWLPLRLGCRHIKTFVVKLVAQKIYNCHQIPPRKGIIGDTKGLIH
jgi:hypothetical protein